MKWYHSPKITEIPNDIPRKLLERKLSPSLKSILILGNLRSCRFEISSWLWINMRWCNNPGMGALPTRWWNIWLWISAEIVIWCTHIREAANILMVFEHIRRKTHKIMIFRCQRVCSTQGRLPRLNFTWKKDEHFFIRDKYSENLTSYAFWDLFWR